MFDEISKSFQKVYDAIDEWVEEVREILKQEAHQVLRQTIYEASKFKEELDKKKNIKIANPITLRNECVTFLRDYGVKESYKGTEYIIYILLNHRSSDILKLSGLVDEIVKEYNAPKHSVRANLNRALEYIDENSV
jgi:hypothetical protein